MKTSESGRAALQIFAMARSVLALGCLVFLSACARPPAVAPGSSAKASAPSGTAKPPAFGAPQIDAALREEWAKAGVTAAAKADDATFLRRAYVDIVGSVPPPEVTAKFLVDTSPDKRARMIDTLLASPEYAEHWTTYWDDVLMGTTKGTNFVDRTQFRRWLAGRFAQNVPWDRLVTELVAATGENGADDSNATALNGAVNWTLKYEQNPQDLSGSASRYFLGVQIQCAQCHDHKTESWTQDDYRRFTSAFLRAKVSPIDREKMAGQARRVVLEDFANVSPRFQRKPELKEIARARPTALDGTDLSKGEGTRKALAAWMTSRDNPYFAKAFVNRLWGHFLGRGFIDPVDDMRPSNPATAPALLERLAADFATDFDVKRLIRSLAATEAYQLAARREGDVKGDPENKLWASFRLVPLGPPELLSSLFRVTDLEHTGEKLGVRNMEQLRANVAKQYSFLFDTDEEDDQPDYSGTVTQALTLLNGALVAQGARALPGSATAALVSGPGTDAEKVDALAMRVYARHATPAERDRWVAYVNGAGPPPRGKAEVAKGNVLRPFANKNPKLSEKAAAYEDLLWSMLNSSEFTFNH